MVAQTFDSQHKTTFQQVFGKLILVLELFAANKKNSRKLRETMKFSSFLTVPAFVNNKIFYQIFKLDRFIVCVKMEVFYIYKTNEIKVIFYVRVLISIGSLVLFSRLIASARMETTFGYDFQFKQPLKLIDIENLCLSVDKNSILWDLSHLLRQKMS